MPSVFLSYRRQDSAPSTGRLYDHLVAHFGAQNIFRDIDTLAPGAKFEQVIQERIHDCDAIVVVIGGQWVKAADESGRRRLDDPEDLLVAEIAEALRQGKRVIPALLDGARMPTKVELPQVIAALTERHAIEISERRFNYDANQLVRALDDGHGKPGWWSALANADTQRTLKFFGGGIAAVATSAWAVYVYLHPKPDPQPDVKAPSVKVIQRDIEGDRNQAIGVEGTRDNGAAQPTASVKVEQSGAKGNENQAVGVTAASPSKGGQQ